MAPSLNAKVRALALLAASACARELPLVQAPVAATLAPVRDASPSPVPPPSDVAGRSRPEGPSAACTSALPALDLLTDNLATTRMSALGEIVASSKTGPGGRGPAPTRGYVTFRYEVEVVRWLRGQGADRLVLLQTAEADLEPKPPGTLLLFSACTSSSGDAYEPDVGYFFPVDPSCRDDAEALGTTATKRVRPSTNDASACKQ
ncbi:MAG: hypothetical protein BGO98_21845 [Myxococcales bacterium 68-20]|nr:hypothetical protein [Myxococcales bacterium]OJY15099.1 MAG: hypothetical protein BGO98_21845 [Myxococcales bacterium 68-20]